MRNRWGSVALLCAATVLVGCEDVTEILPGDTYELIEAEGQELPAVVFDQETEFGHMTATALSGTLTLEQSTYTERIVFNIVLDGEDLGDEPVVVNGDYVAEGQILTFDPDRAGSPTFTGTVSGNELTTVEEDPDFGVLTLVWQR